MEFIVEVSHPYAADDSGDERFECENAARLAARIESETGFSPGEAAVAAFRVAVDRRDFEHEDIETGVTVTAWVAELVA